MLSKMREGLVYALIGPAGSGKTSICAELVKEFSGTIVLSVAATTRAPRPGEVDGVSKHFLTREQFKEKIKNGELFEWEEVHGQLYGQLNQTIDRSVYAGSDLLLDIDIRGALKFKTRLPNNTIICFIAPPSADVLIERIRSRSSVSDEELKTRLATAEVEYRSFLEFAEKGDMVDYFVVNETFEKTYAQIRAQLLAERAKISRISRQYLERVCSIK